VSERFTEMLGVLAHEMRTPIAAILGYQELLADGIFGTIDPRSREPLSRIAYSAKQLLHLVDGVQEVMSPPEKRLEIHPEIFDPAPLLRSCIENAMTDAIGRNVRIAGEMESGLPHVSADPDRFCRTIDLAIAAAVKTSHGNTIDIDARARNGVVAISIAGTGLQPGRDDPPSAALQTGGVTGMTGAGLRLAIARHFAEQMDGEIALRPVDGTTTLFLELPALPQPA
jgi:signal transduction histidine kinase